MLMLRKLIVKNDKINEKEYNLINFLRTNNFSAFHQRPVVNLGDKVKKGDVIG